MIVGVIGLLERNQYRSQTKARCVSGPVRACVLSVVEIWVKLRGKRLPKSSQHIHAKGLDGGSEDPEGKRAAALA